jgi:dihydroorotate dehydrogenase (NAD+) catalytic subunit
MDHTLPVLQTGSMPLYDIEKTYEENFAQGPFFSGDIPSRILKPIEQWHDFLGHKVASPLGVPAGPLLNSKWTTLATNLGFDIVTYKTIRTQEHPCQPLPNIIHVETNGSLTKKRFDETLKQARRAPSSMDELAITNSFGVPSKGPLFLLEDIEKANNAMQEGQVMIVSIMGTNRPGDDFISDSVRTAALAKEAGAKIVEINFSCPNVTTGEGSIYQDPDTVYNITTRIVKELGDIPLIIKVGYFENLEQMKKTFTAAARAGARAVCGINTIGMRVNNAKNEPALGPNRLKSGVCGGPIRQGALEFIRYAKTIIHTEKLGLKLLGVGGITLPEHFDEFIHAGADVAMSATGMMWDPHLARKWHLQQ